MNQKGQAVLERAVAFLGIWLVASIVWAFYLDGINVAIAGCLTAIGALSLINITVNR